MAVTTLTTVGWLGRASFGGRVYAYARSLGSGEPGREDYLRELMLKNIGGYAFIYASVLSLPVMFYYLFTLRGVRRAGVAALLIAQVVMIGLSQYTYAILFTAAIVAVELLAALLRAVFKRLSVGASFWCTLPFFAALWLARVPLTLWAGGLAAGFGFENAAYSLSQLAAMLTGGVVDTGTRLTEYQLSLEGIAKSPLFGSLFGGEKLLGMHSDLLDLPLRHGRGGHGGVRGGRVAHRPRFGKGDRRLARFPPPGPVACISAVLPAAGHRVLLPGDTAYGVPVHGAADAFAARLRAGSARGARRLSPHPETAANSLFHRLSGRAGRTARGKPCTFYILLTET